MKKLATGVDIIEVDRVALVIERQGNRFLQRVFTFQELVDSAESATSLAARFAAKEAVAKALSTGIGPVTWHEIEILSGPAKEPILQLHGEALRLASEQGLEDWSVSLSHTETSAIAFVVALGGAPTLPEK